MLSLLATRAHEQVDADSDAERDEDPGQGSQRDVDRPGRSLDEPGADLERLLAEVAKERELRVANGLLARSDGVRFDERLERPAAQLRHDGWWRGGVRVRAALHEQPSLIGDGVQAARHTHQAR